MNHQKESEKRWEELKDIENKFRVNLESGLASRLRTKWEEWIKGNYGEGAYRLLATERVKIYEEYTSGKVSSSEISQYITDHWPFAHEPIKFDEAEYAVDYNMFRIGY